MELSRVEVTTCPLLAGQQAGHFLGALLSQIGNIPLPDEQLTNLAKGLQVNIMNISVNVVVTAQEKLL